MTVDEIALGLDRAKTQDKFDMNRKRERKKRDRSVTCGVRFSKNGFRC